jgi:hypothetical protein
VYLNSVSLDVLPPCCSILPLKFGVFFCIRLYCCTAAVHPACAANLQQSAVRHTVSPVRDCTKSLSGQPVAIRDDYKAKGFCAADGSTTAAVVCALVSDSVTAAQLPWHSRPAPCSCPFATMYRMPTFHPCHPKSSPECPGSCTPKVGSSPFSRHGLTSSAGHKLNHVQRSLRSRAQWLLGASCSASHLKQCAALAAYVPAAQAGGPCGMRKYSQL